ncbi:MAG: hypothetical protein MMC33_009908 [Icmadophila ericetorum]|nr:hypothetical protein [Icmadophila ericetorum]
MDVGQEMEISRSKLAEAHREGEFFTAEAQSELSISKQLLAITQSKIATKEREIRTKTNKSMAEKKRKQKLDSEISSKNREIYEASRVRESKKGQVAVGAGLGLIGIALVPVTFRASLELRYAWSRISKSAAEISNLKGRIIAANESVSRLQSNIAQADRYIAALERQKRELQRLIKQYQSEVDTTEMKHQEYRAQIQKLSRIKSEISLLQNHALSTNSNVTEAHGELQQIKQKLDTCSALLVGKLEDIQTSSGFVGRLVGKENERERDFKR